MLGLNALTNHQRLPRKPAHWYNDRLHFFKYMTAGTAKIVLENQTLRWSTPAMLNDPFDVQFEMGIRADRGRLKRETVNRLWRLYNGDPDLIPNNAVGHLMNAIRLSGIILGEDEFDKEFGEACEEGYDRMLMVLPEVNSRAAVEFAKSKILCLTSVPDNTLMWSHYAASHSGVVLRLRSVPALDSPYGMAKPVNYVEHVPEMFHEDFLIEMSAGLASIDTNEIIDRMIYTKSSAWAYQNEWRVQMGSGRNPDLPFDDCQFSRNELDGIIFGLRTSEQDRTEIRKLAQDYPNAQLMEMRRTNSSFQLRVEET